MVLLTIGDYERAENDISRTNRLTIDNSNRNAIYFLLVYVLLTAILAVSVFYDFGKKNCVTLLEIPRFLMICLVIYFSFTYDGKEILYGYQLIFSMVFYLVQQSISVVAWLFNQCKKMCSDGEKLPNENKTQTPVESRQVTDTPTICQPALFS